MSLDETIYLEGKEMTIGDVIAIAEGHRKVDFRQKVWDDISRFREGLIQHLHEFPRTPIYGVNRGCGDLLSSTLKKEEWEEYLEAFEKHQQDPENVQKEKEREEAFRKYLAALEDYQIRYIKAHNCGTGYPFPIEVVRAAIVIRLNSFAKGHSAVRPETCRLMISMLNRGLSPWVLEEGSVGASGDLVPLAMIGAVLLGMPEAKAYYEGELLSAPEALSKAGLKPTRLGTKEAMALTNGSNFIAALAVFAVRDAEILLASASVSAALSLEAIRGEKTAFSHNIAEARQHEGQIYIAAQMRRLLEGSRRMSVEAQKIPYPGQITSEERYNIEKAAISCGSQLGDSLKRLIEGSNVTRERIHDRYSFKAIPQVHGAVYEAIKKVREVISIEINSATDNPLFFENEEGDYRAESGGNFHGQPLALVIDYLKAALTGLALITDKRTFSMLDRAQSFGLPGDLAADSGRGDTGLMLAQYAGAARAAESRILSTPASIMSISTAANQEDFVSMGLVGALHLRKIINNTQIVVAIELLCALRALQMTYDYLPPELRQFGCGTNSIYDMLNTRLPKVIEDQYIRTDMEEIIKLVKSGELVRSVEGVLK